MSDICVKVDKSPYYLKDNLSYINREKTANEAVLNQAKIKCPTKCIIRQDK